MDEPRTIRVEPSERDRDRAEKIARLRERIEEERERRKRPKTRRREEAAHNKVARLCGFEPDTEEEWIRQAYRLYKKNLLTKQQARSLGCRMK